MKGGAPHTGEGGGNSNTPCFWFVPPGVQLTAFVHVYGELPPELRMTISSHLGRWQLAGFGSMQAAVWKLIGGSRVVFFFSSPACLLCAG